MLRCDWTCRARGGVLLASLCSSHPKVGFRPACRTSAHACVSAPATLQADWGQLARCSAALCHRCCRASHHDEEPGAGHAGAFQRRTPALLTLAAALQVRTKALETLGAARVLDRGLAASRALEAGAS